MLYIHHNKLFDIWGIFMVHTVLKCMLYYFYPYIMHIIAYQNIDEVEIRRLPCLIGTVVVSHLLDL